MKAPVDTVAPNLDIYTLAERFIHEHRRRYPVVHEGKLVGQISRRDVLRQRWTTATAGIASVYRFARISSLTCFGLALPPVAFITWVTKSPAPYLCRT